MKILVYWVVFLTAACFGAENSSRTAPPGTINGVYSNRLSSRLRMNAINRYGGGVTNADQLEDAVCRALDWLQKHQNEDGSWGGGYRPAMTGLALLTFLAHGETQTSKQYGHTVQRGVQWLIKQGRQNGSLLAAQLPEYQHAIATCALAEDYALTQDSELLTVLEGAVSRIVSAQSRSGAWEYGYRDNCSVDRPFGGDLSISGWNIQALKAAKNTGVRVKGLDEAMRKALDFCKAVYDDKTRRFGYAKKGSGSDGLVGVGILSMMFLGAGDSKEARGALKTASNFKCDWNKAREGSSYTWYYVTQAMFQSGGSYWVAWNREFRDTLLRNQVADGHWTVPGSREDVPVRPPNVAPEKWWVIVANPKDSPIYHTALLCLALESYYRFAPVTEQQRFAQTEVTSQTSAPLSTTDADGGLKTIPLKQGLYGIPFGASLNEISKWCDDKGVQITSPTAGDVQRTIREQARLQEIMMEDAQNETLFLSNLEKEVIKQMGVLNPSNMEAVRAAKAREFLALLKGPSVISKGVKYYLVPVVPKLSYKVKDAHGKEQEKVCQDEAITTSQFMLVAKASAEMQKDGFGWFIIFFWKDGADLVCYAVIGVCDGKESRSKIAAELDNKYGQHKNVNMFSEKISSSEKSQMQFMVSNGEDPLMISSGTDSHQEGMLSKNGEAFWIRAVGLLGMVGRVGLCERSKIIDCCFAWAWNLHALAPDGFVYYDAEIASRILTRQKEVLRKAEAVDNAAAEKQESDFKKRAKENF